MDYAANTSYTHGKPLYASSYGSLSGCSVFPCAVGTSIPISFTFEDNEKWKSII